MAGAQNLRTPPWVYRSLDRKFGPFQLDAAANKRNALCDRFYDNLDNGLEQNWIDPTFCNPPFGSVSEWLAKAGIEWRIRKIRSIVLAPSGGSQGWWHRFDPKYVQIYYPTKRIIFSEIDGTFTRKATLRDTVIVAFGYTESRSPDFIGYRLKLARR